jgi:hypothetical protein
MVAANEENCHAKRLFSEVCRRERAIFAATDSAHPMRGSTMTYNDAGSAILPTSQISEHGRVSATNNAFVESTVHRP